jgi:hypothetical protein
MKEKAQVLANDRKANTMFGRAMLELEQERVGRFAKAAQVTAAEPAPEAFPAADWTRADPGLEPVLGYSVEDLEPTGTCKEVQASIERSRASDASRTERDSSARVVAPLPSPNSPAHETGGDADDQPVRSSSVSQPKPVFRRPVHEQS